MTTKYQHLIGGISPFDKAATRRELEDGKILLEAREATISTPVIIRQELRQDFIQQDLLRQDPMLLGTPSSAPQVMYQDPGQPVILEHQDAVEDSVEIHEAAEQLKALSHPRHVSHDHF